MAKPPRKLTKAQKDPAKPTRAKASRPDEPATPDALADLLNPGIKRGSAGMGSQTGGFFTSPQRGEVAPKARVRGADASEGRTPSPADAARRRPLPQGGRQ
jgi:excinuclease ABC subunit B